MIQNPKSKIQNPPCSVVLTVRNEGASIGALLATLQAQTRPPDEVVITDGGSTDDTVAQIEAWADHAPWPLRVLRCPGANISAGRNAAIAAARHDLLAVTDAGVRLEPGWLAALLAPFADEGVDVVSGFFAPDAQTVFEQAMGATVLPTLREVRPATFLPSSRSIAFRRAAWAAVGGYPEWLDYCEDLVFDLALRDGGYRFQFAPDALVLFRPRGTLRAFFTQYYRYARGDGKADLWRKRHAIRYGTYAGAGVLLALGRRRAWPWALLGLGAIAYCATPARRLRPMLATHSLVDKLRALALIPVIRVVGDVAKMCGYPVGVWWRRRVNSRR